MRRSTQRTAILQRNAIDRYIMSICKAQEALI